LNIYNTIGDNVIGKLHKNLENFWQFISDTDAIIKPVVIDGDIYGFVVWKQGHNIEFYNTDFENTASATIGYKKGYENDYITEPVSFKEFLDYAERITREIETELKYSETTD